MFGAGSQLVVFWESVELEKRVTMWGESATCVDRRPRLRVAGHRRRSSCRR